VFVGNFATATNITITVQSAYIRAYSGADGISFDNLSTVSNNTVMVTNSTINANNSLVLFSASTLIDSVAWSIIGCILYSLTAAIVVDTMKTHFTIHRCWDGHIQTNFVDTSVEEILEVVNQWVPALNRSRINAVPISVCVQPYSPTSKYLLTEIDSDIHAAVLKEVQNSKISIAKLDKKQHSTFTMQITLKQPTPMKSRSSRPSISALEAKHATEMSESQSAMATSHADEITKLRINFFVGAFQL